MTTRLDRRAWMSGVGAAAAGVALGATPVDAWFDSLPGKHRVILDSTSAQGAAEGIGYSNNVFNASRSGYQLEDADLALVLVLRHSATSFAFNNAMWAKYGKQLAEGAAYTTPNSTETPKSNPRNSGDRPAEYGYSLIHVG